MTPQTVYNRSVGDRFAAETELVVLTCTCGILFAIPARLNRSALKHRGDGGWQICCPLGHQWHYVGQTEEEKLRDRLQRERDRAGRLAAERDQAQASLRATRGVATRRKKQLDRVAAGVCPCCGRSFQNLARHMQSQHPTFGGHA